MEPAAGLSHGRAELRRGAFATRQEDGIGPAAPEAGIESIIGGTRDALAPTSRRELKRASARLSQCGPGVRADALDHRAQAVGPLRRQMVAKSEFVEYRDGVGC